MKQPNNYYRYIDAPKNSVNTSIFFNDIVEIKERCVCGSGFWPGQWQHNSEVFTDEFRSWLERFGCKILKAEAFRVFPHTALAWHNDTNDNNNSDDLDLNLTTKINFMWGDLANCFMEYGELIDPSIGKTIIKNKRGRRAYVYDSTKMAVISKFNLERPILINRGPAHRVVNQSNKDWICLSCIIADKITGEPILYENALDLFRSVYTN